MARTIYEKLRRNGEMAQGQTKVLVENSVPLPLSHYRSHVKFSGIETRFPWLKAEN
jgi:hypothetical protein